MKHMIGFFIPFRFNFYFSVKIMDKINFRKSNDILSVGPFFCIENAKSAVESFLEAIMYYSIDEAKRFVVSHFIDIIDLEQLKNNFTYIQSYKYLSDTNPNVICTKKHTTGSVLLIDKKHNTGVINFSLLNQPDNFSKWKIVSIS